MELDLAGKGDEERGKNRPHLPGAPVGETGSGRSVRLLTMVAIAAVCGLSALLLVPGMYIYDLFVNGGGDDEFCGIGTNTVVFGYDLGCDVDWRQIFVVSGMVWFV